MAHDVFISYASDDKPIADGVCAALESRNIRCWVAPRDVLPGQDYAAALVGAIHDASLMVLVFSASSNDSPHVTREVERAASRGIPIVPFRIEDVPPSTSMEYYISATHWLDAVTPPMQKHLQLLADTVERLLTGLTEAGDDSADSADKPPRKTAVQDEGTVRKPWYKSWIPYVAAVVVVLVAVAVVLFLVLSGGEESPSVVVSETSSTTTTTVAPTTTTSSVAETTTTSVAETTTTTREPDVLLGPDDFSREVALKVGERVRIELEPWAADRIVSVEWTYQAASVQVIDVGTTEVNGIVTECWLELEAVAVDDVTVRAIYTRSGGGTKIPWVGYLFISG